MSTEAGGPVFTLQDPDDYWVVNTNPNGLDIVHRNPREECNLDDARGRDVIDAETADALLSIGEARRCEHCCGANPPT